MQLDLGRRDMVGATQAEHQSGSCILNALYIVAAAWTLAVPPTRYCSSPAWTLSAPGPADRRWPRRVTTGWVTTDLNWSATNRPIVFIHDAAFIGHALVSFTTWLAAGKLGRLVTCSVSSGHTYWTQCGSGCIRTCTDAAFPLLSGLNVIRKGLLALSWPSAQVPLTNPIALHFQHFAPPV